MQTGGATNSARSDTVGLSESEEERREAQQVAVSYWVSLVIPSGLSAALLLIFLVAYVQNWVQAAEHFETLLGVLAAGVLLPWFAPLIGKIRWGEFELETNRSLRQLKTEHESLQKTVESVGKMSAMATTQGVEASTVDREEKGGQIVGEASNDLRTFFGQQLNSFEKAHLHNLRKDSEFVAYLDVHSVLRRELEHLLGMGLVQRKRDRGIRTLFRARDDIRNHFQLTEAGEKVAAALDVGPRPASSN